MLPDSPDRTPLHTRTLTFRGFARPDGLWDMEGELHDSKHYDYDSSHGPRKAGTADPPHAPAGHAGRRRSASSDDPDRPWTPRRLANAASADATHETA
jgi:hypothetical protein